MLWIFGSFQVTSCALTSSYIVIGKQGSTIRTVEYNKSVTGRRSCVENHAVRCEQSAENLSRARDTLPSRGFEPSDDTACKGVQAVAPSGSRKKGWDKKKSPLGVYVSPSISQLTTNSEILMRRKWEICFHSEVCFIRSLKLVYYVWCYSINGVYQEIILFMNYSSVFLIKDLIFTLYHKQPLYYLEEDLITLVHEFLDFLMLLCDLTWLSYPAFENRWRWQNYPLRFSREIGMLKDDSFFRKARSSSTCRFLISKSIQALLLIRHYIFLFNIFFSIL